MVSVTLTVQGLLLAANRGGDREGRTRYSCSHSWGWLPEVWLPRGGVVMRIGLMVQYMTTRDSCHRVTTVG